MWLKIQRSNSIRNYYDMIKKLGGLYAERAKSSRSSHGYSSTWRHFFVILFIVWLCLNWCCWYLFLCTVAVWLARLLHSMSPHSGKSWSNYFLWISLTGIILSSSVCAMHEPTIVVSDVDWIKKHCLQLWGNRLLLASGAYRRTSSQAGTSRYVLGFRIYSIVCFS